MARWLLVAGVVALAGVASCSAPPPPPLPPTVVNLTLTTTPDVNPTIDNVGAPLSLRVYQLTAAANFNAAEFFPLYNADAATLKTDIVHRQDFLLAPATTQTIAIKPDASVKTIGIFAAYRNFQTAIWRASVDLEPNKINTITLTAGHDGVTLKTTTALPAPPAS